jgi:hypothetical protein
LGDIKDLQSFDEVVKLINTCVAARRESATALNSRSFRSHFCVRLHLKNNENEAFWLGLDLAGNENIKKSKATG